MGGFYFNIFLLQIKFISPRHMLSCSKKNPREESQGDVLL